jgi:hypothetical protein
MDYPTLLQEVEEVFFGLLQRKTGWGRNEIMDMWREAVIVTLARKIDAEGGDLECR